MKIFLLIVFFSLLVFGNDLEKSYNHLNTGIDKISKKLTLQEEITLYYFSLLTHDKIATLLYKKQITSDDLQAVKKKMLLSIANLQHNKQITPIQIAQLRNSYAKMNQEAKKMLLQMQENKNLSSTITHKEIEKKPYIRAVLLAFILLFILISTVLAYLLYQSKNTHVSHEDFPAIHELEKQNKQLAQQIINLQSHLKT